MSRDDCLRDLMTIAYNALGRAVRLLESTDHDATDASDRRPIWGGANREIASWIERREAEARDAVGRAAAGEGVPDA